MRKLLLVPVLILAGCGVEFPAENTRLEMDGYKILVQEFSKGNGNEAPFYIVGVFKVPFSKQRSLAIKAIEQVADCKVDLNTVRLRYFSNRNIKPIDVIASTVCQMQGA